jgi:O-antigen/teichoic acid export membrane protein
MEEKIRVFISISVVTTLVSLGLNILAVVVLGRGIRGMLEAALGGSLILLVVTLGTVAPVLRFGVNRHWVPQLVKIGFPSIFGLGAFFCIDWADRVMLQYMVGARELGIYSIGYSFGMAMALIAEGAFGSAWPPFFMSFINKRAEAVVLFGRVFKCFTIGCGTMVLVFFALSQLIVTSMTTEPFHAAHTVVGLVATAYMLKVCYLILLPGIVFEKKLHIQSGIEWTAALLNVGLNLLLIPLWHKEGAAIATLCSYLILAILAYFISRQYLPVEYDMRNIVKYGVTFTVAAVALYVDYTGFVWRNISIKVVILCAFCALVYRYLLSRDERQLILSFLYGMRPKVLSFEM